MDPVHQFQQSIGAAILALFLAAIVRVLRRLHVPYLVNGWNPWGRKFDEASALKQNQSIVRWCFAFAAGFILYGIGAIVVALIR